VQRYGGSMIKRLPGSLTDPDSLPFALTSAALIGAGTLLDPSRLSVGGRAALRFGTAAFTGVSVMLGLRKTPIVPAATAISAAVAAMGSVLALSEATEALDARMQRALVRAGSRRPRLVLAGLASVLSLSVYAADRIAARRGEPDEVEEGLVLRPIAPELRSLIDGMLGHTERYAAAALRAQLETVQQQFWSGPQDDIAFVSVAEFTVDETLPRAVPHEFTFPVKARFTTPRGVPVEVALVISGGRLASLVMDVDLSDPRLDEIDDGDPLQGITEWPSRDDVRYVEDTPD
jgi:hypothetical protein